jgi:hypothetical protein
MQQIVAHVRSMDHSVVMPFAKHLPERTKQVEKVEEIYKNWGFRHRHTHDSQVWQHCVVIPLAKRIPGRTGKVDRAKECVVPRQRKEGGRTKL